MPDTIPNPNQLTLKTLSKIESLELTLETLQQSTQFHEDIIFILSIIPHGNSIINMATNFKKLNYLKSNVLPRRKSTLIELQNEPSMPKGIKNSMILKQIKLIKKATNEIAKRTTYHNKTLQHLLSLN
jgi:hypothetical protein